MLVAEAVWNSEGFCTSEYGITKAYQAIMEGDWGIADAVFLADFLGMSYMCIRYPSIRLEGKAFFSFPLHF